MLSRTDCASRGLPEKSSAQCPHNVCHMAAHQPHNAMCCMFPLCTDSLALSSSGSGPSQVLPVGPLVGGLRALSCGLRATVAALGLQEGGYGRLTRFSTKTFAILYQNVSKLIKTYQNVSKRIKNRMSIKNE